MQGTEDPQSREGLSAQSVCGKLGGSENHLCRDVQAAVVNVDLNTRPKKGI